MNRARSRKTRSDAGRRSVSELLFEQYLRENGYPDWEYEPAIPGKSSRLDYRIRRKEGEIFCEIKQLVSDAPFTEGSRCINPYLGIRKEIHEVRRQFKAYKDSPCVLVLFDHSDRDTILEPYIILAAMLGNMGVSFSVGEMPDEKPEQSLRNVFLKDGKMRDPKTQRPQNTTISAIAVLERHQYQYRNDALRCIIRGRLEQAEREKGRPLELREQAIIEVATIRERWELVETKPRVVVVENPDARIRLPDGCFTGVCDERWGFTESKLVRTFAGSTIRGVEADER